MSGAAATNALIAINLLLDLTMRAQQVGTLIAAAQKEGRDLTTDELNTLANADDAARIALNDAIAEAVKQGR